MRKSLYDAPITRKTPLLIGFLLDMSGSMDETVGYDGVNMSKSEALNIIVNRTIEEMLCRCRSIDGIRNYFEFAAVGYGGEGTIRLFEEVAGPCRSGNGTYTVEELESASKESFSRQRMFADDCGNAEFMTYRVKQYIKPHSSGQTPMYMALQEMYGLTKKWLENHSGSVCFPPVIINVTDGEATDATYREIEALAARLKSLRTENGNVLLLNIHVGNCRDSEESVRFPVDESELPCVKYAQELYRISSIFPESMLPALMDLSGARDPEEVRGSRMMTFNSSIATILQALTIGTVSMTNYCR